MVLASINAGRPEDRLLARAARVLGAGGLVAFPTETYYGLGADSRDESALAKLLRAKGRRKNSPILLLLASLDQIGQVAASVPAGFTVLARAFWPGPLTLVVPAREDLSSLLTGGAGTIGVRVPGMPLARDLARVLGRPITGTSANRSGEPPSSTAAQVCASLRHHVELVLDGGPAPGGAPSTIVDLCAGAPRLIRQGVVPFERILRALAHRPPL